MRSSRSWLSEWLKERDAWLYLGWLGVCVTGFVFFEIADELGDAGTKSFEREILLSLRASPTDPIGPDWFENLWLQVTALGSSVVITMITVVVVGFLLIQRSWRLMAVFLLAILGGALGSSVLKLVFERERPSVVKHLVEVESLSFPSGHSLISAVAYPTLGALLSRVISDFRLKLYVMSVALLLTAMVGFSRVYLGVHYPSDVLGGWSLGLCWSLVCWSILRQLQKRKVVPNEPQ